MRRVYTTEIIYARQKFELRLKITFCTFHKLNNSFERCSKNDQIPQHFSI